MQAIWQGTVIAESDETVVVEGNHYFPNDAVDWDFLTPTDSRTTCFWKGEASYFSVTVDGHVNPDSAFTYREPSTAAEQIRDHIAFWRGVEVR